ncbi:MAG: DUF4422 domain-containing protein [Clostridia bacterium]|nr:DUF4422 domain-containing protein [Clostridia bacterium]
MIYIVTHKRVDLPKLKGYRAIQVGNAADSFPGCLRDDTGDNIADKNASYCELTALYWVWKNSDDPYKGLAHYRRYFGRRALSSRVADILGYDALVQMLEGRDMLAAKPAVYHVSAREQLLMECCTPETFAKLERVVESLHPESMDAFRAFFAGNRAAQYNMLFCRSSCFDDYCAWLFPMLFSLEDQVDLSGANAYQKRLFGFLSERLLNVWILQNGLSVKYLPVVSTEYTPRDHLTYLRRDITNGLRFRMQNKKEG